MKIEVSETPSAAVRDVLLESVSPRPIGWVSTVDTHGRPNLAPFSFFNLVSTLPPVVVFSCSSRRGGGPKDTLANIRATMEFVHNLVTESLLLEVEQSSQPLPRGVSEAARAGLELLASSRVGPPRVARSPVAMECKVLDVRTFGSGEHGGHAVFGEVLVVHVDDAILSAAGQLEASALGAVGRVGSSGYCLTKNVVQAATLASRRSPVASISARKSRE